MSCATARNEGALRPMWSAPRGVPVTVTTLLTFETLTAVGLEADDRFLCSGDGFPCRMLRTAQLVGWRPIARHA